MPSSGRSGATAAVRLWAGRELRRRWRALVALGVIAGLAAGLAMAAVAGARRTATVYDRYRAATAAPDAIVFATQLGITDQDYSAVVDLPEVVDAGTFNLAPIALKEHPIGTLAPGDDHLYRTLGRPLLAKGRLPDPDRDDEIVYAMAEDTGALRALGLTNPEVATGLVLPLLVTAGVGAGTAGLAALGLSHRFPVGLGRRLEPDLGIHADWVVLGPGAVAVAVLVATAAGLAAWRARPTRRSPAPGSSGSAVVRAIRRRAPLPVAIGAGLALESGRGRRSLPARPALAGAVVGVRAWSARSGW